MGTNKTLFLSLLNTCVHLSLRFVNEDAWQPIILVLIHHTVPDISYGPVTWHEMWRWLMNSRSSRLFGHIRRGMQIFCRKWCRQLSAEISAGKWLSVTGPLKQMYVCFKRENPTRFASQMRRCDVMAECRISDLWFVDLAVVESAIALSETFWLIKQE